MPLPIVLYIKPIKSSADGEIKKSIFLLASPILAAAIALSFCLAGIPVLISIILLKKAAFLIFSEDCTVVLLCSFFGVALYFLRDLFVTSFSTLSSVILLSLKGIKPFFLNSLSNKAYLDGTPFIGFKGGSREVLLVFDKSLFISLGPL